MPFLNARGALSRSASLATNSLYCAPSTRTLDDARVNRLPDRHRPCGHSGALPVMADSRNGDRRTNSHLHSVLPAGLRCHGAAWFLATHCKQPEPDGAQRGAAGARGYLCRAVPDGVALRAAALRPGDVLETGAFVALGELGAGGRGLYRVRCAGAESGERDGQRYRRGLVSGLGGVDLCPGGQCVRGTDVSRRAARSFGAAAFTHARHRHPGAVVQSVPRMAGDCRDRHWRADSGFYLDRGAGRRVRLLAGRAGGSGVGSWSGDLWFGGRAVLSFIDAWWVADTPPSRASSLPQGYAVASKGCGCIGWGNIDRQHAQQRVWILQVEGAGHPGAANGTVDQQDGLGTIERPFIDQAGKLPIAERQMPAAPFAHLRKRNGRLFQGVGAVVVRYAFLCSESQRRHVPVGDQRCLAVGDADLQLLAPASHIEAAALHLHAGATGAHPKLALIVGRDFQIGLAFIQEDHALLAAKVDPQLGVGVDEHLAAIGQIDHA